MLFFYIGMQKTALKSVHDSSLCNDIELYITRTAHITVFGSPEGKSPQGGFLYKGIQNSKLN